MDKQKYIMIGTKNITKEIFRNVLRPLNNFKFLPTGGFWSCEYNDLTISEWFNYLIDNDYLINNKDITSGVIFTLKDNARILNINDYNTLQKVIKKYPSYHHTLNFWKEISSKELSINFELLSKDYDGIFVNYKNFALKDSTIIFNDWDVNTLLLFNLDIIENYTKAKINFLLPNSYFYYILEEEPTIYHIEEESIYYKELNNYIKSIFNELLNTKNIFNDYNEYFSYLIEVTKKSIEIANNNKLYLATSIKNNLNDKGINTTKQIIIRNITTNILSNYLKKNVDKEKELPKTLVKKIREYKVDENKKECYNLSVGGIL